MYSSLTLNHNLMQLNIITIKNCQHSSRAWMLSLERLHCLQYRLHLLEWKYHYELNIALQYFILKSERQCCNDQWCALSEKPCQKGNFYNFCLYGRE